ncbi:uncharacterized protein LOC128965872 [Oppia nitens]|uniref:uncharacterized protein LOC128965872 n=1 Tax=Oppia nitens TaxID=1686743 RepID=UPI0023DAB1CC|nr:uncharacterized protein LOC128965872 [Oppia nitens]
MFKVLILAATTLIASAQYKKFVGSPAYYGYAPEIKSPIYATYTDTKPVYETYKETPSPYSFGYTVDDGYGNKNHKTEEGDAYGNKKGSYGYTDAYGVYRKVDYIADEHGFRASISTNEPGVGSENHYGSTLQQKEEGDSHGNKKGSYGYTDGHGIYRQVDYVADKNGFRATIKTNEPGTSDQDPADVHIDSSARNDDHYSAPQKAQSYSAPSYSQYAIPSYGHQDSYSSYSLNRDSHGYSNDNDNKGYAISGNAGYARSHSIPAVYYAKGY